jgi:hypothetical protein
MFFDGVVIGKGEKFYGTKKCYEGPDTRLYISECGIAYWITDLILDGEMTIYKDTMEGQALTQKLADNVNEYELKDFLDTAFLHHATHLYLMQLLLKHTEAAYLQGKEDKAKEIRKALNIEP